MVVVMDWTEPVSSTILPITDPSSRSDRQILWALCMVGTLGQLVQLESLGRADLDMSIHKPGGNRVGLHAVDRVGAPQRP